MAGRYLITGVQIGMIQEFLLSNKKKYLDEIHILLEKILDEHFIGDSKNEVGDDIKFLQNAFAEKKLLEHILNLFKAKIEVALESAKYESNNNNISNKETN